MRNEGMICLACLASLTILTARPAVASESDRCSVTSASFSIGPLAYDPFSLGSRTTDATLRVGLETVEGCRLEVALADGAGGPLRDFAVGAATISVQLSQPTPPSVDALDPTRITTYVAAGERQAEVRWTFRVIGDAVLSPGQYDTAVQALVVDRDDSEPRRIASTYRIDVRARAQANIAGAAGGFGGSTLSIVDFGEINAGEQQTVFLQLRANTGAVVQLSSRNGGMLINDAMPGTPIPYSATLDGVSLPPSVQATVPVDPPLTIDGVSLPLTLRVGAFTGALAGAYKDVITVEISPR